MQAPEVREAMFEWFINLLTGTARNQCAIKLIFGGFSHFNLI